MNEEMYFNLEPTNGFYEWNEIKKLVKSLRKLGWKVQIISVLQGFKISFKKKLNKSKRIREKE